MRYACLIACLCSCAIQKPVKLDGGEREDSRKAWFILGGLVAPMVAMTGGVMAARGQRVGVPLIIGAGITIPVSLYMGEQER